MDGLNLIQIEQISRDVQREDISFSHLCHDLIDHVCCDVEYEMQKGLSFLEAYQKVKEKIGFRGLKKIQSDTLYAVDSKYRTMKNIMKISGVIGTILLGFAALFKIMHWPGAGIMLTLGAFAMAFIFMPSALSVLYKESKSGKSMLIFMAGFLAGFSFILAVLFKVQHWPGAGYLILSADVFFTLLALSWLIKKLSSGEPERRGIFTTGTLGAVMYLTGLLFKFQHWPGAAWLLLSGSFVLFIIAFPWYTWVQWKDAEYTHATYIFLVPALIWIFTSGGLISLRTSGNYMAGFLRDYQRQEALNDYLLDKNQRMMQQGDSLTKIYNQLLHQKTMELYDLADQYKRDLVSLSPDTRKDADPKAPAFVLIEGRRQMEARTPIHFFAVGSEDYNKIKSAIASHLTFLQSEATSDPVLSGSFAALFQDRIYLPDTSRLQSNNLGTALNKLSLLQNSILVAEEKLMKTGPDENTLVNK